MSFTASCAPSRTCRPHGAKFVVTDVRIPILIGSPVGAAAVELGALLADDAVVELAEVAGPDVALVPAVVADVADVPPEVVALVVPPPPSSSPHAASAITTEASTANALVPLLVPITTSLR
jgi:hypothetical protein